jgi:hypothetical protein
VIKILGWGQIIGGIIIMVVLIIMMAMEATTPPSPPPLSMHVYTPSECVIEVSNYLPDGRQTSGKGIVLDCNGEFIILTSSMIFTHEGEYRVGNCKAELIHQNDVWGLIALRCFLKKGTAAISLNETPNLLLGTQAWSGENVVQVLEYLNDDWIILTGNLLAEDTGMPVEQGRDLVGIIIGLNCIDTQQAIMVSIHAIREFVNQVILIDAPPVLNIKDTNNEF